MAVNVSGASNGNANNAAFSFNNTNNNRPQGGQSNNVLSFGSTRDMVPRNQSSEYLTTVLNKWREGIKIAQNDIPSEIKLGVYALDRGPNAYLSSIIVVATVGNEHYYHTLLLANTNQKPSPVQEQMYGKNIEVVITYSDVSNPLYNNEVTSLLKSKLSGTLFNCGASVLPADFNINDNDSCNKAIIVSLLATIANNNLATPITYNLDNLDHKSVAVNLQYTNDHVYNLLGSPVRSDVVITTSTNKPNVKANVRDLNASSSNAVINRICGYIDQAWQHVETTLPYGQQYGQVAPVPKLQPRFIITNVEITEFSNLPATLFAISSSLILGNNRKWYNYYLPKSTIGNKVDIKDFGYFNIDVALGGESMYIDTKASGHTTDDLFRLINATCHPDLTYSIDCSLGGDDTSINDIFSRSLEIDNNGIPTKDSIKANSLIIEAANMLTNGYFDEFFPAGGKVFAQNSEIVYLGYYEGEDGSKRDIRELDYLAVLALGGSGEPTIGADYTNTIYNESYPIELRLHERRKIESNLLKGNYTITDKARRCTFTAAFLNALQNAILKCNISIVEQNPTYGIVASTQRSNYGLSTTSSVSTNNQFFQQYNRGGFVQVNNSGWGNNGRVI